MVGSKRRAMLNIEIWFLKLPTYLSRVIQREVKSFGYAFRGLKFLFRTQIHFRIEVAITVVVVFLGFWFCVTASEWMILLLCCASVLGAEALNSALEVALDRLHPERHPLIGKSKDMAAAGVLLLALFSAVIGVIIFFPYFQSL